MIGICVAHTITVRGMFGDRTIDCWQFGDWAVHRQVDNPSLWAITFIPQGLSLPFAWASFRFRRDAIAAMTAIGRLKNSWRQATQADFDAAMRRRLMAICTSRGAIDGGLQVGQRMDHGRFGIGSAMNDLTRETLI